MSFMALAILLLVGLGARIYRVWGLGECRGLASLEARLEAEYLELRLAS